VNRRAVAITAIAFVIGVGVDLLIGYSPVPGYGASIGLFGCIVIVVVSKWIGTALLERPESALGDEAPPDLHPDLIGDPDHPALRRAAGTRATSANPTRPDTSTTGATGPTDGGASDG
jgi:hypothetical protein